MGSQLTICNNAIHEVRGKRLNSINESTLEARLCQEFYPQVIKRMLEGPQPLGFTIRRVVLAEASENDREYEWLYAYSVPNDMAKPIKLIPDLEESGLAIPMPLPGEPYAEMWTTFPQVIAPYIIENGILYSNAGGATLAYVIDNIEEADLPQLVVDALSLDLAAELAIPLKGMSRAEKREIMQEAELAWQRARAEDMNRQPEEYPYYVSEAEAARQGHY